MLTETYDKLDTIYSKHGSKEFGKIIQKFLAISFLMDGYTHIEDRGVQGVDIDISGIKGKLAIEVKTTIKDNILFGQKDADGLRKRTNNGYKPILAILKLSPLSDWLFLDAEKVKVGTIPIFSIRPYRITKIEEEIIPHFNNAVNDHYSEALDKGQSYLTDIIKSW